MCNDSKGFAVGATIGLDYDRASSPKGETTVSERDPRPADDRFHSTRWSEVLAVRDLASPQACAAVAELCRTYWYPLYAFARRKGYTVEQAEDLTQGFLTDGLARNFLQKVDPSRGKFRSFLLSSFVNYLKNQHEWANRFKRGGGVRIISIDAQEAEARYLREPEHVETAERLYDRRWASPCSTTRSTNWSGR